MKFFRAVFVEHFTNKAIALLLACIFWVMLEEKYETTVTMDLDFPVALPDSLRGRFEIRSQEPRSVRVKLSGANQAVTYTQSYFNRLKTLGALDTFIRVDPAAFNNAEAGKSVVVPVKRGNLNPLPLDVRIELEREFDFVIVLDQVVSRNLKVRVPNTGDQYKGELPQGYAGFSVTVKPEELTVQGASSVVNGLATVDTEPIALGAGGFTPDNPAGRLRVVSEIDGRRVVGASEFVEVSVQFVPREAEYSYKIEDRDLLSINVVFPLGKKITYAIETQTLPSDRNFFLLKGPAPLLDKLKTMKLGMTIRLSTVHEPSAQFFDMELENPWPDQIKIVKKPSGVKLNILSVEKTDQ